jgi:hypothetical protein
MNAPTDGPREEPAGPPTPGWYDDPTSPGRPRWWDGERWAESAAPRPVTGSYAQGGVVTGLDVGQELRSGQRARTFMWIGLVGAVANAVISVPFSTKVAEELERIMAAFERGEMLTLDQMDPSVLIFSAASQVILIASVVAGVLFLVWFYRAMTNARALGLRQRIHPVLVVIGLVVPAFTTYLIPAYVMPYLASLDLFPPGHRACRVVKQWWAAWVGAQLALTVATVGHTYELFGVVVVVAVVAVAVLLNVVAAVLVRSVIQASIEEHRELAVAGGLLAADADLRSPAARPPQPGMPRVPGAPAAPGEAVPDPWKRAAERESGSWPGY